mmetsp:Transcript_131418/g.239030  ORF Transcript_131418/g.239030 Transcript_131418/m.239030 type:complete len:566 (-) Transcript_131418:257-1954(-)
MQQCFSLAVPVFFALLVPATSKSFLPASEPQVELKDFKAEIQDAMGAMLGCGGETEQQRVREIEKALKPMWQTLPKNEHGRIERRSLRYAVHRYFMQQSSLMIRGFEPSRPTNQSHWGVADILSQQVPGYVEAVLESHHAQQKGFGLEDAVSLVVMLEQLILDSDHTLLDKIYRDQRKPTHRALTQNGLKQVLEAYLVNWMVGEDQEAVTILLSNKTLLQQTLPHWDGIVSFAQGQATALDFDRQQFRRNARNTLAKHFSFDEVHDVVGSVTKTFASFWDSECASMKNSLVEMDTHGTGRVPLSKFYAATVDGEWRFGESEEYLREMGALDETSAWHGKQVIIPNYMQAASNCIVSTPHYLVCCVNECEALMGEIEVEIGAPTATPKEILAVVGNMTSQTTLDDDAPPHLKGSLTTQLKEVANANGGKVPLHGRLFAQWLHYAFPRECPFPHKTGVAASVTPSEFGDGYLVKKEDMHKHAANASAASIPTEFKKEDLQWMSQWSEEEELTLDYSVELHAPWEPHHSLLFFVTIVLAAVGISGGVIAFGRKTAVSDYSHEVKAHWV